MNRRRSREEWAELVEALRASGEPLERFARRRGLNASTLRWWTSRFARDGVRLLPVVLNDAGSATAPMSTVTVEALDAAVIELAVGDVHLRFRAGTDGRYVAALVAELRDRC